MSKKHKIKPAVAVNNRTVDPYITLGAGRVENDAFWRWAGATTTSFPTRWR